MSDEQTKMFKATVYVIPMNFNYDTKNDILHLFEEMSDRCDSIVKVTDLKETNIGVWHDEHPLNSVNATGKDHEQFMVDDPVTMWIVKSGDAMIMVKPNSNVPITSEISVVSIPRDKYISILNQMHAASELNSGLKSLYEEFKTEKKDRKEGDPW